MQSPGHAGALFYEVVDTCECISDSCQPYLNVTRMTFAPGFAFFATDVT
jgi:hypothetical protein